MTNVKIRNETKQNLIQCALTSNGIKYRYIKCNKLLSTMEDLFHSDISKETKDTKMFKKIHECTIPVIKFMTNRRHIFKVMLVCNL